MAIKALSSASGRWKSMVVAACFLLALGSVGGGVSQVPQVPPPGPPASHSTLPGGDIFKDEGNPMAGPNAAKLEHMREDDRRKRLLADTSKLVELSTQLQSDVEKTPKDQLSLDVVKKAAEIEKLAHDVKERMKG